MGKSEKPKFKVGDIIVITCYGTVGTVTEIKKLGNQYFYEVNHNDILFAEKSLSFLKDYEKSAYETEKLELQYQYYFGDVVMVKGYGSQLFKVVGLRTEIWRYKEEAGEETIYELSRIKDGEWLEANEDELMLIADQEHADVFLQNLTLRYLVKKDKKSLELLNPMNKFHSSENEHLRIRKEKQEIIDGLLDVFNDYKLLYDTFEDEEYKMVMELVIRNLQKITSENKL